ncbi:MAG: hypothetical protein N2440_00570 [Actinobacteria bacterium]|nr:hypothetical protein [Actinomycetota bacterium]
MFDYFNVLFVDSRNVSRSLLACAFAQFYSSRAGMSGLINFDSCGISAINGMQISDSVKKIAEELGVNLPRYYARNLFDVAVSSFDLIVVFEEWHKVKLQEFLKEERTEEKPVVKLGNFIYLDNLLLPKDLDIKDKVAWLKEWDEPSSEILSPLVGSYEEHLKKAKIIQEATRNLVYFFVRR